MLQKEELLHGYQKYYGADFNQKEVEALMEMADQNGDGTINFSEFIMTAVDRNKFMNLEKMEAMFSEIDTDHSGTLSYLELETVLMGLRH